jgi:hypothetical protein
MLSDEVGVALAPARTYARLVVESPAEMSWWRVFERPTLVLLVIGVSSAIAATGRITLSLAASSMLLWSFVIAVQLVAAALLIVSVPARSTGMTAAIDLFFAGHLPWSIWIMVVAAWNAANGPYGIVVTVGGAILAGVRTATIVNAFNVVVLGTTLRGAQIRTAAHQALILFVAVWFIAATSGGWYRLVNP